ncbi:ribonuclease III domain-containing protein [Pterulicium gracile]|uniref:Large ribosomal subunit protein mL44 n=1 Tax=Pterulicium gracile TaxID=1884261 RepID=A0A5C3QKP1_9AGAR|nr:ribonuclease III domain-containing protein [Pterula gracilis]
MGGPRHVTKRLYTQLAKVPTVSTSHLPKFPPKEAIYSDSPSAKPFSPEIWAQLQPPPPSALSAFVHRIGMNNVLGADLETVQLACTHSSFVPFHKHYHPQQAVVSNAQLAHTGNALLGMFGAEHVHATYPYLPTRVLKAAVTSFVGPASCAAVANEMGATPLLRWHRTPRTPTAPAVLQVDALASIPRALTALVYQNRSLPSARQFAHSYLLNRQVDLRPLIKFTDPKKALLSLTVKFNRDRPVSRLLKETGRFSNSPVFVVGIYSGQDKLGEGFGSSLKMAEYRAAEDSLLRLYLTRRPTTQLQLPTSTFAPGIGNIFTAVQDGGMEAGEGSTGGYAPPELVESEIMYQSGGKSGVAHPSAVWAASH